MNKVAIFQFVLKILIPIVVILITRYVTINLNPVTKCDNILKMMVYIVIMAFLVFIEIALILV